MISTGMLILVGSAMQPMADSKERDVFRMSLFLCFQNMQISMPKNQIKFHICYGDRKFERR